MVAYQKVIAGSARALRFYRAVTIPGGKAIIFLVQKIKKHFILFKSLKYFGFKKFYS